MAKEGGGEFLPQHAAHWSFDGIAFVAKRFSLPIFSAPLVDTVARLPSTGSRLGAARRLVSGEDQLHLLSILATPCF